MGVLIINSESPFRATLTGGTLQMLFDQEVIISLTASIIEKLNEMHRAQGASNPDLLLTGTFSMVAKGVPLEGMITKIFKANNLQLTTINMVVEAAYKVVDVDERPMFELQINAVHMFEEDTLPEDMRKELHSRYATHFKH